MLTCYDCIHCDACSDTGDAGVSSLKEDVSKCKHFKNKKDFTIVGSARWKGAGMGDYYCSLCQEVVTGNEFKFCPHCGAKMDGGGE